MKNMDQLSEAGLAEYNRTGQIATQSAMNAWQMQQAAQGRQCALSVLQRYRLIEIAQDTQNDRVREEALSLLRDAR